MQSTSRRILDYYLLILTLSLIVANGFADEPKTTLKYAPGVNSSGVVPENRPFSLKCESKPQATNYSWYHDDNLLLNKNDETLFIFSAKKKDAGKYSCTAFTSVGNQTSNTLPIFVKYPPQCRHKERTTQYSASNGSTIKVECEIDEYRKSKEYILTTESGVTFPSNSKSFELGYNEDYFNQTLKCQVKNSDMKPCLILILEAKNPVFGCKWNCYPAILTCRPGRNGGLDLSKQSFQAVVSGRLEKYSGTDIYDDTKQTLIEFKITESLEPGDIVTVSSVDDAGTPKELVKYDIPESCSNVSTGPQYGKKPKEKEGTPWYIKWVFLGLLFIVIVIAIVVGLVILYRYLSRNLRNGNQGTDENSERESVPLRDVSYRDPERENENGMEIHQLQDQEVGENHEKDIHPI